MDNVKEIVLTATTSLIICEIIYYLTPKDKLVNCIYSLIYTVIITFSAVSICNVEFDFNGLESYDNKYQNQIDDLIYSYYKIGTESEMKELVEQALTVVNIPVSKVETIIDVGEDEIVIKSIKITLLYKQDIQNAKVILNELFKNQVPMEVVSEG